MLCSPLGTSALKQCVKQQTATEGTKHSESLDVQPRENMLAKECPDSTVWLLYFHSELRKRGSQVM